MTKVTFILKSMTPSVYFFDYASNPCLLVDPLKCACGKSFNTLNKYYISTHLKECGGRIICNVQGLQENELEL